MEPASGTQWKEQPRKTAKDAQLMRLVVCAMRAGARATCAHRRACGALVSGDARALAAVAARVVARRTDTEEEVVAACWRTLSERALRKLRAHLQRGDAPSSNSRLRLSALDWSVVDLLLLYDTPLLSVASFHHPAQLGALTRTCELVQRFMLEPGPGQGVAPGRWNQAAGWYCQDGFQLSAVALQRRWHELKLDARLRAGALAGPRAPLLPVHQTIATRYPHVVAGAAAPAWRGLVAAGAVAAPTNERGPAPGEVNYANLAEGGAKESIATIEILDDDVVESIQDKTIGTHPNTEPIVVSVDNYINSGDTLPSKSNDLSKNQINDKASAKAVDRNVGLNAYIIDVDSPSPDVIEALQDLDVSNIEAKISYESDEDSKHNIDLGIGKEVDDLLIPKDSKTHANLDDQSTAKKNNDKIIRPTYHVIPDEITKAARRLKDDIRKTYEERHSNIIKSMSVTQMTDCLTANGIDPVVSRSNKTDKIVHDAEADVTFVKIDGSSVGSGNVKVLEFGTDGRSRQIINARSGGTECEGFSGWDEEKIDLKLLMYPVVLLERIDKQWRTAPRLNPSQQPSIKIEDSLTSSPIHRTPLRSCSSTSKEPVNKFSLSRVCQPCSVVLDRVDREVGEEGAEEAEAGAGRKVELPDMEEVRRHNRGLLTAQVAPLARRQLSVKDRKEKAKETNKIRPAPRAAYTNKYMANWLRGPQIQNTARHKWLEVSRTQPTENQDKPKILQTQDKTENGPTRWTSEIVKPNCLQIPTQTIVKQENLISQNITAKPSQAQNVRRRIVKNIHQHVDKLSILPTLLEHDEAQNRLNESQTQNPTQNCPQTQQKNNNSTHNFPKQRSQKRNRRQQTRNNLKRNRQQQKSKTIPAQSFYRPETLNNTFCPQIVNITCGLPTQNATTTETQSSTLEQAPSPANQPPQIMITPMLGLKPNSVVISSVQPNSGNHPLLKAMLDSPSIFANPAHDNLSAKNSLLKDMLDDPMTGNINLLVRSAPHLAAEVTPPLSQLFPKQTSGMLQPAPVQVSRPSVIVQGPQVEQPTPMEVLQPPRIEQKPLKLEVEEVSMQEPQMLHPTPMLPDPVVQPSQVLQSNLTRVSESTPMQVLPQKLEPTPMQDSEPTLMVHPPQLSHPTSIQVSQPTMIVQGRRISQSTLIQASKSNPQVFQPVPASVVPLQVTQPDPVVQPSQVSQTIPMQGPQVSESTPMQVSQPTLMIHPSHLSQLNIQVSQPNLIVQGTPVSQSFPMQVSESNPTQVLQPAPMSLVSMQERHESQSEIIQTLHPTKVSQPASAQEIEVSQLNSTNVSPLVLEKTSGLPQNATSVSSVLEMSQLTQMIASTVLQTTLEQRSVAQMTLGLLALQSKPLYMQQVLQSALDKVLQPTPVLQALQLTPMYGPAPEQTVSQLAPALQPNQMHMQQVLRSASEQVLQPTSDSVAMQDSATADTIKKEAVLESSDPPAEKLSLPQAIPADRLFTPIRYDLASSTNDGEGSSLLDWEAPPLPSREWARGRSPATLCALCLGRGAGRWAQYLVLSAHAPPPPRAAVWALRPRRRLLLPGEDSAEQSKEASDPTKKPPWLKSSAVAETGAQEVPRETPVGPSSLLFDNRIYQKVSDEPLTYAMLLMAIESARVCQALLERDAPLQLYCLRTCSLHHVHVQRTGKGFLLSGDSAVEAPLQELTRQLSQLAAPAAATQAKRSTSTKKL